MSRIFLDTLKVNLSALLVTDGAVTAPQLLSQLIDVVDSTIRDEAVISASAPVLAVPTAVTWAPLTTGIYDTVKGGDAEFLKVDAINGTVTGATVAGYSYLLEAKVSFTDLSANTPIEFSILADGLQVGFVSAMTGGGGTRARSAAFTLFDNQASSDVVYTVGIQTPNGINTLDIIGVGMLVSVLPTNNP